MYFKMEFPVKQKENDGSSKFSLHSSLECVILIFKSRNSMGSMHGVISGEGLRMLDNFRRS